MAKPLNLGECEQLLFDISDSSSDEKENIAISPDSDDNDNEALSKDSSQRENDKTSLDKTSSKKNGGEKWPVRRKRRPSGGSFSTLHVQNICINETTFEQSLRFLKITFCRLTWESLPGRSDNHAFLQFPNSAEAEAAHKSLSKLSLGASSKKLEVSFIKTYSASQGDKTSGMAVGRMHRDACPITVDQRNAEETTDLYRSKGNVYENKKPSAEREKHPRLQNNTGQHRCVVNKLTTCATSSSLPSLMDTSLIMIDPRNAKKPADLCRGKANETKPSGEEGNHSILQYMTGQQHNSKLDAEQNVLAGERSSLSKRNNDYSKKKGNDGKININEIPHPLMDVNRSDANDIVLRDLPKDITEVDVINLVRVHECGGFKHAQLVHGKEPVKCFVEFTDRAYAIEAVAKLYGKAIRDHCVHVYLAENHKEMEVVIAKKALLALQGTEIPQKIKSIERIIEQEISKISSELEDCLDFSEDNLASDELEIREKSEDALKHRLQEQSRFRAEFQAACNNIKMYVEDWYQEENLQLSDVDQIRLHFARECRHAETPLPVYGYRTVIQSAIRESKAVVLQGETGSGKSTQIPQYLVDMELHCRVKGHGSTPRWKVVCTQPRRVAAISLAKRVAEEYGCRVGDEVGSLVGDKRCVSDRTVVTFMTDRKLLNMCATDPTLCGYNCVIVDEAHERSVDTDILLANLKSLLQKRSDLHLLIMSATIDTKLFSSYLGDCKEVCVPGRTYPVEKIWCGNDSSIGEDDYVEKAVELALKIHEKERSVSGDILVFVTSANEIERACRNMASRLSDVDKNNNTVVILPLHGRLTPEDQMKVFLETKDGQRKVVFATNVAETSVTIKGIKYVIDTGAVKECQYDPKRSMSLLKVTSITKAASEQRAGRAGRTAPGVCYRLYTREEYGLLEETMKPEILRVHLGMATLQLLKLGVTDVANFDFIEAPNRDSLQQAMETLRLLGAVDKEEKLTDLGHRMAKLTLEPRLSKLVLEGAAVGVATEAVIIAALISAPGSIFYRGGSERDKEKADRLKMKFCNDGGDVLTMLSAYAQWNNQAETRQKAWCIENSMNSKTLRVTRETVKEIAQVIKHEDGIVCNYVDFKIGILEKALCEKLQKVILSAFFQTLSVYNGHPRAGYTVLLQQKSALIHPSSSHQSLGINPKWVVYEEFKRTSRDFLFIVTQVDVSWLSEVAPVFAREVDVEKLRETAMEEMTPAISLGTALMRQICMKRQEKLRILEESMPNQTPCVIVANYPTKELHVFINKMHSAFAASRIKTVLEYERDKMRKEQKEISAGKSNAIRQVISAGAVTAFILMAQDYRTLKLSNMPDGGALADDCDDVGKISSILNCPLGDILNVHHYRNNYSTKNSATWGHVTFVSPDVAEKVKQKFEAKVFSICQACPIVTPITVNCFQGHDIQSVKSRIVVTWETWPSKGVAFVNCTTGEEAVRLHSDIEMLRVKGLKVQSRMKRNDPRGIMITALHRHVIQEELEKAIRALSDVPFIRCMISRQQPVSPILSPEEVTQDIYTMFGLNTPQEQQRINIDVLPPKSEKTQTHKAIVTVTNSEYEIQIEARIADIQADPPLNGRGQIYRVKDTASCMLFCNPRIYSCLEVEVQALVRTAQTENNGPTIKVSKSKKSTDYVIYISGGSTKDVRMMRQSFLAYIKGETISLADLLNRKVSQQMRTTVMNILHKTGVQQLLQSLPVLAHATVDLRRQAVIIYGTDSVRTMIKRQLEIDVQNICIHNLKDFHLEMFQCSKGKAVRALVKAFGPYLKKLQDESQATQITLNTRHGVLLVEGTLKVFDRVQELVQNCLRTAGLENTTSADPEEGVECGVCFTSIAGTEEVYRLSNCSHSFHHECLVEMFDVRLKSASREYPIVCPCDGCGSSILLCDVNIICKSEDKRLRLYQLALEAHVSNSDDLKFCPTADCQMIYTVTSAPETWVCPDCRNALCSSCGEEPHSGMTCRQSKGGLEEWMKTRTDVKRCPVSSCGAIIERVDGCNHMNCTQCKHHICWVCLEYFKSADECYAHLRGKHGGYFNY